MRPWPFNRRRRPEPIDKTWPATGYPNRSGALGPALVDEVDSRRRAGSCWYDDPTQLLPEETFTWAQRHRGGF